MLKITDCFVNFFAMIFFRISSQKARSMLAMESFNLTGLRLAVLIIGREVRKWISRRQRLKIKHEQDLKEDNDSKWAMVLHWDHRDGAGKKITIPKGFTFSNFIHTDGVSIRLLFTPIGASTQQKHKKRKRKHGKDTTPSIKYDEKTGLPKYGLYTIDQLKHESRLRHAQVIGADPGKRELLVCVDIDEPSNREDGKVQSVRYTSAQRRSETLVIPHQRKMDKECPTALKAAMNSSSSYNSRSSYLEKSHDYFTQRRSYLREAQDHFSTLKYRERSWIRYRKSQESFTDFVRRIKGMSRENAPMILAYGSWANVAGRPGTVGNKGIPPCLGKGLRAKLSNHFIIASTPEQWTSKLCSACGEFTCEPCKEVDTLRRAKLLAKANELPDGEEREKAIKKASRFSVRGLRRCTNEACAVFHNRDYNGGFNIGKRGKHRLWPELYTTPLILEPTPDDAIDEKLSRLNAELEERF
jgi:hypothetical protein